VARNASKHKPIKGILTGLKLRLHKNRLGELLVLNGFITPQELQNALQNSKLSGKQLGTILTEQNLIDRTIIRRTLTEQIALRVMMASLTLLISVFSFGGISKQAKADSIKDVPARVAFQNASAFAPVGQYPKIFGSTEKRSTSLTAFTKWTGMFDRFDAALNTRGGQSSIQEFKSQIAFLQGLPMDQMVTTVNDIVNRVRYVNDIDIYGKSDFWATPIEFFSNGGDCEDYAIAKYTALRALGVPEERLRILIVQDLQKNIPHAILVVYTDSGAMVLDNQIKTVISTDRVAHYKPIFSINRQAWWLHTKPRGNVTVVASSAQ
jgi:predicted transglutaminase-like cysteine proteinase